MNFAVWKWQIYPKWPEKQWLVLEQCSCATALLSGWYMNCHRCHRLQMSIWPASLKWLQLEFKSLFSNIKLKWNEPKFIRYGKILIILETGSLQTVLKYYKQGRNYTVAKRPVLWMPLGGAWSPLKWTTHMASLARPVLNWHLCRNKVADFLI